MCASKSKTLLVAVENLFRFYCQYPIKLMTREAFEEENKGLGQKYTFAFFLLYSDVQSIVFMNTQPHHTEENSNNLMI